MNQISLSTPNLSKYAQLRALLTSPQLEFIMEAHNGISAKIVEEAGFKGIWASGLALSAQYGVRDNNEASWTQITEMLEFMSDATQIPILLDGDTGYGNFNNMRRLVKKLEQRGIAGVCIEDKLFPKTNSFINSDRQPLADIDEFCGKIQAGKDSQNDADFCIIARTEALIAGWDLSEALKRAEAYRLAGADAILIHSKSSRPDQVLAFAQEWANRAPLVIVPTKYYSTPTDVFREAGISLIIWANHLIRGAVAQMQAIAQNIHDNETLIDIEDKIAPIKDIFRLQGADELLEAEKRYFSQENQQIEAIVLGASRGQELANLTQDLPKVMLPIEGKPLLRKITDQFKQLGISNITVIGGYKAEKINIPGIKLIVNQEYETTSELASLACAETVLTDLDSDTLVIYGDLLLRSYIIQDLLNHSGDMVAVVDSANLHQHLSGSPDYAYCSAPDIRSLFRQDVNLLHIDKQSQQQSTEANGRWVGMLYFRKQAKPALLNAINALKQQSDFNKLEIPDLCNYLIAQGNVIKVLYINGHWLDVNALDDLIGDW